MADPPAPKFRLLVRIGKRWDTEGIAPTEAELEQYMRECRRRKWVRGDYRIEPIAETGNV